MITVIRVLIVPGPGRVVVLIPGLGLKFVFWNGRVKIIRNGLTVRTKNFGVGGERRCRLSPSGDCLFIWFVRDRPLVGLDSCLRA